jgi:hypothetical protein
MERATDKVISPANVQNKYFAVRESFNDHILEMSANIAEANIASLSTFPRIAVDWECSGTRIVFLTRKGTQFQTIFNRNRFIAQFLAHVIIA